MTGVFGAVAIEDARAAVRARAPPGGVLGGDAGRIGGIAEHEEIEPLFGAGFAQRFPHRLNAGKNFRDILIVDRYEQHRARTVHDNRRRLFRRQAHRQIDGPAPESAGANRCHPEGQCDQGKQQSEYDDQSRFDERYAVDAIDRQQPRGGEGRDRQRKAEYQPALDDDFISVHWAGHGNGCAPYRALRPSQFSDGAQERCQHQTRRPEHNGLARHRCRAKRWGGFVEHECKPNYIRRRNLDFFVIVHLTVTPC